MGGGWGLGPGAWDLGARRGAEGEKGSFPLCDSQRRETGLPCRVSETARGNRVSAVRASPAPDGSARGLEVLNPA